MMNIYPSVVTGSSGGIGQAIVELLYREGWPLVGMDCKPPSDVKKLTSYHEVDLIESKAVSLTCERIIHDHPRLWAFVHCAGIYPIVPFDDYTVELWDEVHAVNVRSAFEIAKHLSPSIADGGRIILVASGASHLGSRDVGYSASKSGVIGLMRSLAKNLAPRKILVNAVCPGPIETQMSSRMSPGSVSKYKEQILLKKFGSPKEVAVVVRFLLSPTNTYVTGATIDVTGGLYMR